MDPSIRVILRAVQLRRAGLAYPAIEKVLVLDFGRENVPRARTLREHLVARGEPRDYRRLTGANAHWRGSA
jgi:hypothetical protein